LKKNTQCTWLIFKIMMWNAVFNMDWFRFSLITCHMSIYETTARPSFRPLCISNARNCAVGIIRPLFFHFWNRSNQLRTYSTLQTHYSGSRSYRGGSDSHKSIENMVCDSSYERNTWLNQIFFNFLHVVYYSCVREILGIH